MKAGYLYIMQYPDSTYYKVGRSVDVRKRMLNIYPGTVLHFTMVTIDMRRAETEMLNSLRSAEAVAEGIEAVRDRGCETFRGPLGKIARWATAAARMFPAEPHNLMSPQAVQEWYARECAGSSLSIEQFLIDNECLTDINISAHRKRAASSDRVAYGDELKAEMTAEAREKARELRMSPECCTRIGEVVPGAPPPTTARGSPSGRTSAGSSPHVETLTH